MGDEDEPRIHLDVTLEPRGDPIRGKIADGAKTIEFTGWLELMSAFDRLSGRANAPGEAPGARD